MEKKRSFVTFNDGMAEDSDKLNQPSSVLRYSLNSRIIFNKDGTFSWHDEKGMVLSFTLQADNGDDSDTYIPLGYTGQSNLKILFSTCVASGFSEIGLVIADENGICAYKTLFNDQNDPNSDKFNFQPTNQIEARFIYENDNLIRVYWVDGVEDDSNQPRVFTFKYDSGAGERNDVAAYSAVSVSVHDMNTQAELYMGLIKYVQSITGNLMSGVYQYTYRLVTVDGYQTPWYPLTRKVFLTTDIVNNTNWNTYEMESSGLVSNKGNRIEIKGIDQRFDQIEVAYTYAQAPSVVFEANVFTIASISGTTMTFDHVSNDGEPLDPSTIPAIFSGIRAAKTLNIKDKVLYYGNIIEGFFDVDADTILTGVTLTPIFRDMRSDERVYSSARYPDVVGSPPITNQTLKTGTTTKAQHNDTGGDETYTINSDYTNYKGTQVEHLYEGYFRGETYRYGIVFFDKLGFPSFVYHLADVTFPQQYEDTYAYSRIESDGTIITGTPVPFAEKAWPTNNYGDYTSNPVVDGDDSGAGDYSYLRIMGVEFSGIDITTIETQISGFQIVRVERDKSIIAQGLIMPCVREDDLTRPFVAANQAWYDFFLGSLPAPGSDIGDIELQGLIMIQPNTQPTTNSGDTERFMLRPNISNFLAPNWMISPGSIPILQTQDQLKLVGGCWTETNQTITSPETSDYNQHFTYSDMCYQALYYSKNDNHFTADEPYPRYGDYTNPTEILHLGIGAVVTNYTPGLDLDNNIQFEDQNEAGFSNNAGDGFDLKGWGKETQFFVHPDFSGGSFKPSPIYYNTELPFSGVDAPYSGYFISNYVRPNSNPYGGQTLSALERNIFISTGHFQPVNNPDFAIPSSKVFDGVEVWGGDCYLDYFSFLRVYGKQWAGPGIQNDRVDATYGHSFPLESDFNTMLRNAPSSQNPVYPDVGARPNEEVVSAGTTNWPNGLFYTDDTTKLLEEFNLNSVLLFSEVTQFYNPKPFRFIDNFKFPVRWRYTQTKFYGDPIDSWRIFQVNDFDDLDGQYGEITSSLYLMDQIYSWQRSAFGRLRASDRALVESANAGSLTTGIGGKLDGIDYINTTIGNQNQWSLFGSSHAAYWINVDMHKICRFAQDGYVPISDARGQHQYALEQLHFFEYQDNPAYTTGISGVWDERNQEAKWSFVRDRKYVVNRTTSLVSHYSSVQGEIMLNDDEMVTIEFTGDPVTQKLVIPVNETASNGVNTLLNFYLYIHPDSTDNLPVYMYTNALGLLFTGVVGSYYQIYRSNISGEFTYRLLEDPPHCKHYKTLTYSEANDRFEMFNVYQANFYMTVKDFVISYNSVSETTERDFYAHDIGLIGNYYGEDSYSLADAIFSENAAYEKTFDNLYLNINRQGYDNLTQVFMYTDSQFYQLDLTSDTRKAYKEDKMKLPLRLIDQVDRMHGKHIRLLLDFSNDLNRQIKITNLEVVSRLSTRV